MGSSGHFLITLASNTLGGHYIAYCRNNLNNLWYELDDKVSQKYQNPQCKMQKRMFSSTGKKLKVQSYSYKSGM